MAVPKRKTSKMKGRKRRTHYKTAAPALSVCPRCLAAVPPHTVCGKCGYYRGRQVVDLQKQEDRKAKAEAASETPQV